MKNNFIKKRMYLVLVFVLVIGILPMKTLYAEEQIVFNDHIENLISKDLTNQDRKEIKEDLRIFSDCGITMELIYEIKVNSINKVYKLKYINGFAEETIEEVIIQHDNSKLIINTKQGNKQDCIIKDGKNFYLNGNKMKLEEETINTNDTSIDNTIEPMADRDIYNVIKCPYGVASDYNDLRYTETKANIPLEKKLCDYTTIALSVTLNYLNPVIGISFDVANEIVSKFYQSESKGLSYKNFVYYHKNGRYISKIGGYVQKNNVRWYEKINYGGSSKVIPTYKITKYY